MTLALNLPTLPGRNWRQESRILVGALALGLESMADAAVASARAIYPSGTRKAFAQASAPIGWALDQSAMDRLLRIVSGSGGGAGGSWTVSGLTAKGTAIGLGQIPLHGHTASTSSEGHGHSYSMQEEGAHFHTGSTDNTGGHSHTVSMSLGGAHYHQYSSYQSGTGTNPGNRPFSWSFTSGAAGAHTHVATIGSSGAHSHGNITMSGGEHSHSFTVAAAGTHAHEIALESAGGDEPHNHGVTSDGSWRPSYLDVILCTRL